MRKLVGLTVLGCWLGFSGPCFAQGWPSWADDIFGDRSWSRDRDWRGPDRFPRDEDRRPSEGGIRSGGPRPDIAAVAPPVVGFNYDFPANSIVIDTGGRKLYYVLPDKRAYEYRISVGREGFNWTGTEKISRKQEWPDWYPPVEMRERDPSLPEKMTGGVKNPLGAVALYLGNTLYRIHGTNDVKSIGHAQSSGCFRMLNSAAIHLASIAGIGTTVNVVSSVKEGARLSRAPQPPPPPVATQSPPVATPPPAAASPATSQPPPTAMPPPPSRAPPPASEQPPQQQVQSPPAGSRHETAGTDVRQSPPPPPPGDQPPPAASQSPPQVRPPPQGSQQAGAETRRTEGQSPSGDVPDYAALRKYTLDRQ